MLPDEALGRNRLMSRMISLLWDFVYVIAVSNSNKLLDCYLI